MRHALAPRLGVGLVCALFLVPVFACSSGTGFGFVPDEGAGDGAVLGTSPESDAGRASSPDASASSCFDPTCPLALCQCKDKTAYSPSGVCRKGGKCDVVAACEGACGSAGFSGGVWERAPCTEPLECSSVVSQPNVSCDCLSGSGVNAYPTCNEGHCSPEPEHVCPKACASRGGWRCTSPVDCAPVVCACKDGKNPVTASTCSAGSCGAAGAVCPAACGTHGGWAGTSTSTPDAGPPPPKQPGDACTTASECGGVDCSCNNGSTFKNNKLCMSKVCPTKAQACGFICMNSGGWSGS